MLYPRSSEAGIYGQEVPNTVLAQFASHGHLLAVLEEVTEDMPEKFTTIEGVKVGWPEYEEGTEHILYHLPHGKAKTTVELPFYTIWKTQESARRPDRLHARNRTPARRRWKPKAHCRTSRRRSTKKPKKSNRKNAKKPKKLRRRRIGRRIAR